MTVPFNIMAQRFFTPQAWGAAVILILAAAFGLRALRFRQKGLFLWDEAAHYREALVIDAWRKFLLRNFRELLRLKKTPDNEARERLAREYHAAAPAHYAYYKPFHIYSILIAGKFIRQADVATAAPSLLYGTATVAVGWLIGLCFGPGTGLATAVVLAMSGGHIMHSRSGGPEAGSVFCFATAMLLAMFQKMLVLSGLSVLSPGSPELMAAAGFFLCGAYMFNPFWVVFLPPLFVVGDIAFALTAGNHAPVIMASTALLLVCAALWTLLLDIPYFIGKWLFPESGIEPQTLKLIELAGFNWKRLADQLKGGKKIGVKLSARYRFLFYPELFLHTEGAGALVAAALGFVWLIVKHPGGPWSAMFIAMGGAMMVLLTFVPWKAARGGSVFLLFAALFAGAALAVSPSAAAVAALVWFAVRGFQYALRISRFTSGIRLAVEFIRSKGGTRFACVSLPFVSLYGSNDVKYSRLGSLGDLEYYHGNLGAKYLVVDHHRHFPGLMTDEIVDVIETHFQPVFKAEDPCVTFLPLFFEAEYYWTGVHLDESVDIKPWNRFREKPSEADRWVRVYDLDEFFANLDRPGVAGFVLLSKAEKLSEQGKFAESVELLTRALADRPDDPRVKYFLGFGCVRLGRMEQGVGFLRGLPAVPDLSDAMKREAEGLVSLWDGVKLLGEDRVDEAMILLERAREATPSNPAVRFQLGVCRHKKGDIRGTVKIFRNLLEDVSLDRDTREICEEYIQQNAGA